MDEGGSNPSVLFICTGNRCRSVAAAALWQKRLPEIAEDWQRWQVSSAGTWAEEGKPPLSGVSDLLRCRGIDVRGVRSRRVSRELLAAHQLALVMESGQKEGIHLEFPDLSDRVYLLSEMAGREAEVRDPVGEEPMALAATLVEISAWLRLGEKRILELARGKNGSPHGGRAQRYHERN